MPRSRKQKFNKGKGKHGGDVWKPERTDKWEIPSENAKFRAYYEKQKIMQPEEWEPFMKSMSSTLPLTFRVTGSRAIAEELNDFIKTHHLPLLTGITFAGEPVEAPKQVSWYPQGLVWQLNIGKSVVRKSDEFRHFQRFLVYETDAGNISRQELVSMIPPLLLDVQPHHYVMDMCAAPGSKSAQLLEALHAADVSTASAIPSGLLIANDSEYKRTHMLVHQTGRLASPALMVTNLDASGYPNIKIPSEHGSGLTNLKFDRILADVPCSGDGTLRKNVNIWRDWSLSIPNGLHSLQLRILLRGMKMLKAGGLLVYSTCSLNPVENEAVLAAALNQSAGEFSIVDVSDQLPGLIRRPGMDTWTVATNKDGTIHDTYAEYEKAIADKEPPKRLLPTLWPPENAKSLHLERCMRILPQDQDTGAFFVALLQKARRPDATSSGAQEVVLPKRKAEDDPDGQPEQKRTKADGEEEADGVVGHVYSEQPFYYIDEDNEQMKEGLRTLNLSPNFPSHLLFARASKGDTIRSVFLTNEIIRSILLNNDTERIRLINCGTKVIAEHSTGGSSRAFRFLHDGVSLVLPYVKPEEILQASLEDLKVLLAGYNPTFEELQEPLRNALLDKTGTSYLLRIPSSESQSFKQPLNLPLWKAAKSAGLLLDKKARSAVSLRMFGEDVSPVGKEQGKKRRGKEAEAAGPAEAVDGEQEGELMPEVLDGEEDELPAFPDSSGGEIAGAEEEATIDTQRA
ncbi:S-adenosyl-L-methionine-dependent methyltransferase [Calocera viscosa TUFC12733]|uniref:S-adenosyl-L-methionine-dependent methyltransferase n=1 Tax=Calocera viscosa (strain TUFC12733) TaxID=1330018 RepID=A0A167P825_CALVF|nr:S-adenosyl-L-methionine-dependent methyltransferase [Calocera viscosa TUFC12733]